MMHSFATHDLESSRPEDVEIEREGLRVQVFPIEGPGAAAQRAANADEYVSHGQGSQFLGMALQPDQIVEGVDATQLEGVDQAHEQITDLRPVQGAEQAMNSCDAGPFALMPSRPSCYRVGHSTMYLAPWMD
jgi:hypothetical protein